MHVTHQQIIHKTHFVYISALHAPCSWRTKMPTQLTELADVALEIPDKGTTKSEP
ncbi:hypothetical protein QJS04_geneDACA015210 [Acorus gramineus]|uniref:Uncharacterized protein n=1 Tax=Acorus gramineus TaxID=55184 RepID=A0AAV9BCU4_ACOGR|nr:hypothetical protein QJS04_geneDACA015210 [Acorus gramineus]